MTSPESIGRPECPRVFRPNDGLRQHHGDRLGNLTEGAALSRLATAGRADFG